MPSDDLDKVSICPATAVRAARPQRREARGQLACWHSPVRAQLPGHLIETVERYTKDATAELCKGSSTLTQDSTNQAIREMNVRIGGVDGIECVPQKRMVEADYYNFTVK